MEKIKAPERYLHAAKPQLCQMNEVLTFASTFSIWKRPFCSSACINQRPHVSQASDNCTQHCIEQMTKSPTNAYVLQ
jgi:hypothetical protein